MLDKICQHYVNVYVSASLYWIDILYSKYYERITCHFETKIMGHRVYVLRKVCWPVLILGEDKSKTNQYVQLRFCWIKDCNIVNWLNSFFSNHYQFLFSISIIVECDSSLLACSRIIRCLYIDIILTRSKNVSYYCSPD